MSSQAIRRMIEQTGEANILWHVESTNRCRCGCRWPVTTLHDERGRFVDYQYPAQARCPECGGEGRHDSYATERGR